MRWLVGWKTLDLPTVREIRFRMWRLQRSSLYRRNRTGAKAVRQRIEHSDPVDIVNYAEHEGILSPSPSHNKNEYEHPDSPILAGSGIRQRLRSHINEPFRVPIPRRNVCIVHDEQFDSKSIEYDILQLPPLQLDQLRSPTYYDESLSAGIGQNV